MPKAIVRTYNRGCGEVVEERKNRYLVRVRDGIELARRLEKLMRNPREREEFTRHSGLEAETEFNEQTVLDRVLHE
ncbi:MAG: hypothetical protein FJY85_03135 [Deltaproteobacteria bacterium]|nr:hypothetical protein [Deltaproteobacteria bacterium]